MDEREDSRKPTKEALVEALEDARMESIEGKPDLPAKPLFGSENVPITPEEEKVIE